MSRGFVYRAAAIVCVVLVGVWIQQVARDEPYRLDLLMPTADQSFEGGAVTIDGEEVGEVESISVRDGQAVVRVTIDDDYAPLHAGTTARINWESLLGARIVDLIPGDESNPPLQSGHLLTNSVERVELDDVMAILDEPTRKKLRGLLAELNLTLEGSDDDLQRTLRLAGPAVKALTGVLRGLGQDSEAIESLVTELHTVTSTVRNRRSDVSESVAAVERLSRAVAEQRDALAQTLAELPTTLDQASTTLGHLPEPIDDTRALLRELAPIAERLPNTARLLSPVLRDLRPVARDLVPVLRNASELLKQTPNLLDVSHQTFPDLEAILAELAPMLGFLRPYTPELVGWLSNWTSVFASENGAGNYARALITVSASSLTGNPGISLPGLQQAKAPVPGAIVGEGVTDANGDPVQ